MARKKKSPQKTQTPKQNRRKRKIHFRLRPGSPQNCSCPRLSQASGLRAPWHSRGSLASFLQNPFFCKSWFESEFCYLHLKESGLELPCLEMGSSRARVSAEPRSSTPRSESGRATPREEKTTWVQLSSPQVPGRNCDGRWELCPWSPRNLRQQMRKQWWHRKKKWRSRVFISVPWICFIWHQPFSYQFSPVYTVSASVCQTLLQQSRCQRLSNLPKSGSSLIPSSSALKLTLITPFSEPGLLGHFCSLHHLCLLPMCLVCDWYHHILYLFICSISSAWHHEASGHVFCVLVIQAPDWMLSVKVVHDHNIIFCASKIR